MTNKEKTERCRSVLYKYKGKVEDLEDIEFLYSIFECHAQWDKKKGCGVDYFYTGKSEYGNSCFFIMRTDGSTTDISFTSAIKEPSIRSKVFKACRTSIEPEITKFRGRAVIYGKTKCALTGEVLTPQNTHIDHYDLTFIELFDKWLKFTDLETAYSLVTEAKDNECKTYFTNQQIIDDFVRFHNDNTHLRAITKDANLRRPRK